jgi:radical SAM superfamily enzyme YgiQ (UPF0313 family)
MNVLLISPQKNIDIIGLRYIHYYLLKQGHNSSLLCLPNFNPKDSKSLKNIENFIMNKDPGLIGLSLMSEEFFNARDITKHIKKFRSTPIIWGGIHPTISPETCLEYADYVCVGEGEKSMLDLANNISKNKDVTNTKNICYLENGKIKKNQLYPVIENLDDLPQYDHIPINSFIQEKDGRIMPINKKVVKKYSRFIGAIYDVMSSRGCPFSCTYCCNDFISNLYHTKKVRRRSVSNIISELKKALKDNPQIEYINFMDDCFLSCTDEYLKEFCEIYKKQIKKLFWVKSLPIYVTKERIKILKDAGLVWVELGLQSGSDRVCKEIYKRMSFKANFLNAEKIIVNLDIAVTCDVILDNPFENKEDKFETIQTLIETQKPFYPQFFSLSLYLGSGLYEKAKKECPEKIENSLKKDYLIYHNNIINDMIRLAAFLNKKHMNKIVHIYKQNPKGLKFKMILLTSKLWSSIILEPITYFKIIKMSQRGSYLKTFKILPTYFKKGFMRYFNQFRINKY